MAEKEAAKQPKSRPIPVGVSSRTGDNRSLQDIGVKMPNPKKNKDGKDSSSRTGTASKDGSRKPDASFLPRPGGAKDNSLLSSSVSDESLEIGDETATGANSTRGEGKNNDNDNDDNREDVTSATSPEGTGTANNFPSTIEDSVFSDEDDEEDPEAREAREAQEAQALLEAAANDPGVIIEIEEEDEVSDCCGVLGWNTG